MNRGIFSTNKHVRCRLLRSPSSALTLLILPTASERSSRPDPSLSTQWAVLSLTIVTPIQSLRLSFTTPPACPLLRVDLHIVRPCYSSLLYFVHLFVTPINGCPSSLHTRNGEHPRIPLDVQIAYLAYLRWPAETLYVLDSSPVGIQRCAIRITRFSKCISHRNLRNRITTLATCFQRMSEPPVCRREFTLSALSTVAKRRHCSNDRRLALVQS